MWQGAQLTVTVPPDRVIVASKMLPGDDRDFEDYLWLIAAHGLAVKEILLAIRALPDDARRLARDNFGILRMMQA